MGKTTTSKKEKLTTIKSVSSSSSSVGRLIFKGDDSNSKKKKRHKKKTSKATADKTMSSSVIIGGDDDRGYHHKNAASDGNSQIQMPVAAVRTGTGSITSSGTTIMGHNSSTKFSSEFRSGDAIAVVNPCSGIEEMRVVKMVLSDISCSISSVFSSDLKQPTSFQYIHAPKDDSKERRKMEEKVLQEKAELDRVAFGTYASAGQKELVYREKSSTGTSYVIKREALSKEVSRGELLAMRAKKKSDKFC